MASIPGSVFVRVTRSKAACHVWKRLGEMGVPRRQRAVACLIAWTHRPRTVEVGVEAKRREEATDAAS